MARHDLFLVQMLIASLSCFVAPRSVSAEDPPSALIQPGDSVTIELAAPISVPIDGSPVVATFNLTTAIDRPERATLPFRRGVLSAIATAVRDRRVEFKLKSLTFRSSEKMKGRSQSVEVNGWIIGEDGVRGMRAVLAERPTPKVSVLKLSSGLIGVAIFSEHRELKGLPVVTPRAQADAAPACNMPGQGFGDLIEAFREELQEDRTRNSRAPENAR